MPNRFASGKYAIAECDRCGQSYMLKQLKKLTIKTKLTNILVCPECWEPDQPQLQLGMYPVNDPQGIRNPRSDLSYYASGLNGLQVIAGNGTGKLARGTPDGGSRVFQWGWNPVGGARANDNGLTPNDLVATVSLNSVTVQA